jgi:hypothetical protein
METGTGQRNCILTTNLLGCGLTRKAPPLLHGSKQEIIAETDSRFLLKGANVQIEFVKDKSGVVSTLFLYRNGQKMEGKRVPTLQCK